MIKLNPIDELKARLQYLIKAKNVDLSTIIEFDYLFLKNKIYKYCEQTFNKEEFKQAARELFTDQIATLLNNIDSVTLNAKKLLPLEDKGWLLNASGGVSISQIEQEILKSHLSKELGAYILIIETVTGEKITPTNKQTKDKQKEIPKVNQKKAGRKPTKANFIGSRKLSDDNLSVLFNLILPERKEEEFFNQQLSSTEKCFNEIMRAKDLDEIASKNYKFIFGVENYLAAFVFAWLEKNGYINSAFQAIDKSKSFYSTGGDAPLKANDLTKAKSTSQFERFITTTKPSNEITIPQNSNDKDEYFKFLNFHLHDYFHS